jgi:photosystem II stability/assembly factor-like uncharacterized protein
MVIARTYDRLLRLLAASALLGGACGDDPPDPAGSDSDSSGSESAPGTSTDGPGSNGESEDSSGDGSEADGADDDTTEGDTDDERPDEVACTGWVRQMGVPAGDWWDMAWLDANRAFVVGLGGAVISTMDGGETWSSVNVGTNDDLRSVAFAPGADANHGWILGGADVEAYNSVPTTIRHTKDGGATWTGQSTSIFFPPTRVHAIDANRAWIVWGLGKFHPDGHWQRTSNGGDSWATPQGQFLRPGRALMDLFFIDDQIGWAVGSNTNLTIVIDGQVQMTPLTGKVAGITHTKDGGNTWELQETNAPEGVYFTGIHFVDHQNGWLVHDEGGIYATQNGGANWTPQSSGVATPLRAVRFEDASRGWAVGAGGVILHTEDGGGTWLPQDSGIASVLRRIAAPDGRNPWIVGDGGVVLRCK